MADAGMDTTVCDLQQVLAAVPANGTGTWSASGAVTISDPHDPQALANVTGPGAEQFTWTVVNGPCIATDDVWITFHTPEEVTSVNAGPDQVQDVRISMQLQGQAEGATETRWSVITGSGLVAEPFALATTVDGLSVGNNVLELSARAGNCPAKADTVVLTVRGVFVPTGFSPDGDGVNDRYVVQGLEELGTASFTVFDRWGGLVYQSDDYRNDWDGKGKDGRPLMDGTYFGILKVGGENLWNGSITIKR
jgi:gliding motility-associated-like protein